jgi:hypothetical protein
VKDGRDVCPFSGTVRYYLNGQLHRDNAPAVEYSNGSRLWKQHGEEHREDGAAVEYSNGNKYWYLHGEKLPCETQEEFEQLMRLRVFW